MEFFFLDGFSLVVRGGVAWILNKLNAMKIRHVPEILVIFFIDGIILKYFFLFIYYE